MDKQTLSNYGWLVIVTLILAIMLAFATPFGTYVGDGVVSIANGFVGASDEAIDEDNIKTNGEKWDSKFDYDILKEDDVIPEGAMYLRSADEIYMGGNVVLHSYLGYVDTDVITLNAGEKFPKQAELGDIFVDENYIYVYGKYFNCGTWYNMDNQNGWNVLYKGDKNTTPPNILSNIAGAPITHLNHMFNDGSPADLSNIVVPETVVSLYYAFSSYEVEIPPDLSKAISVQDMAYAFDSCKLLTTAPIIPNNVTDMRCTFYDCTSLTTAPTIPSSVTDMCYTFYGCKSLTGTITINANPTSYSQCFYLSSAGKPITLTGTSTKLQGLANTSNSSYRTITVQ